MKKKILFYRLISITLAILLTVTSVNVPVFGVEKSESAGSIDYMEATEPIEETEVSDSSENDDSAILENGEENSTNQNGLTIPDNEINNATNNSDSIETSNNTNADADNIKINATNHNKKSGESEIVYYESEPVFEINPMFDDVISDDLAQELEEEFLNTLDKETKSGINVFSEEDSLEVQYENFYLAASDAYTNTDDAAAALREKMEKRISPVTIVYTCGGDINDATFITGIYNDILGKAWQETDSTTPTEGDYIRSHTISWGADINARSLDATLTITYTFAFGYTSTAAQEEQVTAKVNEVLSSLNIEGKSDIKKITAIYDYVADTVKYNDAALAEDYIKTDASPWSAYGAIVLKTCVCQGYAGLIYRMFEEAGVDCRYITGTAPGGNHAWNIARYKGNYYNLDATWDADSDTELNNGFTHRYFMKSNVDFPNHTRGSEYNTSAFRTQYPMATESYDPSAQDSDEGLDVTLTKLDGTTMSAKANGKPRLICFGRISCGVAEQYLIGVRDESSQVKERNEFIFVDTEGQTAASIENYINNSFGNISGLTICRNGEETAKQYLELVMPGTTYDASQPLFIYLDKYNNIYKTSRLSSIYSGAADVISVVHEHLGLKKLLIDSYHTYQDGNVDISWSSMDSAVSYKVYKKYGDGEYTCVVVSTCSYTDKVSKAGRYEYYVEAVYADGTSSLGCDPIVFTLNQDVKEQFTVTFKLNNGQRDIETTVYSGSTISEPESCTKNGYYLEGWYTDKNVQNISTKWNFDTDLVEGNITLYARWVTYDPVVEVNNSAKTPVNGVYKINYTDKVSFYISVAGKKLRTTAIVYDTSNNEIGRYNGGNETDNDEFEFAPSTYNKKLKVAMYVEGISTPVSTIYIQSNTPITSVIVKGVKTVNGVQTLSPEIGKAIENVVTVNNGADINDLAVSVDSEGTKYVSANITGGKLVVEALNEQPGNQARLTLYDANLPYDSIKNGTIVVTTQAPAWTKTAPTASLVTASDVTLNLKVTAPKGVTLNDNYYVAVKLSANNKTKIPEDKGLTLNDAVKYYKVSGGTIPDISINAFKKDGSETSTLGAGCGTSMDANIYLVLTSDGETPVEGAEGNVIVKAAVKKLTVATKEPYYADKISLKKGTTNLYAGQSGIKIADINLGTKTTYNTTEFWGIKSVVDAKGNDASSYITFKTGTSAEKSATDTGIYAVVDEDTPAGKYKVTVQTKDGFYAPEASIDITVLPTIDRLYLYLNTTDISDEEDEILTYTIYKPEGKSASAKAIVSGEDQDQKIIKNPKVTYTVGVKTEGNTIEAVAGLTVKNGTVTVAKDFEIDDDAQYCLYVRANDYSGNMTEDSIYLAIDDSPVNVKTLELYIEGEEEGEYELIKPGTSIPFDCMPLYAVKDKDGNYILGETVSGDTKTLKTPSLSPLGDTVVINENEALEKSLKLTKPGKVKYTAYGVDGTKASFDLSLTYNSNNDDYNNIWYNAGNGHADALSIDETGNANAVDLTGAAADAVIEIVLSDSDNGPAYNKEYDDYYMVEGSLSVTNAKIIKKNANSQYLKIQMTKSPATVTLTKQVKNEGTGKMEAKKYTWTFKNDALNKAKAPAATKVLVKNTEDSGYAQGIYADYTYNGDNYIEIILKEPLKNSDGDVICDDDSSSVHVELSNCDGLPFKLIKDNISDEEEPEPVYYHCYKNVTDNKYFASVGIYLEDESRMPSNAFSFNINYKYSDDNYLTSTPTTVSVSPAKFKKSFAVNSTQTMSLKDAYTIKIADKRTGVKSVTYEKLLNYNKNGVYNEFADTFKINADKKTITVKDASKLIFKNNLPTALDGYVVAHVVYENGEEADVTSKITVKWVDTTKKYTAVMPTITKGTAQAEIQIKAGGEDCYVWYARLVLVNDLDKNFHAATPNEGKVKVYIKETAYSKPGTYQTNMYIMPSTSGAISFDEFGNWDMNPAFADLTPEEAMAMFGIKVPVKVKVANP